MPKHDDRRDPRAEDADEEGNVTSTGVRDRPQRPGDPVGDRDERTEGVALDEPAPSGEAVATRGVEDGLRDLRGCARRVA
jgi:hypothetical protein